MKSIVLLCLLGVLASGLAQTVNVPITLSESTTGALTISAGNYGSATLTSGTKTTLKGLLGLLQTALSSVKPGSTATYNLPIAINGATATVNINGKSYVVDGASIRALAGVFNQLNQVFSG